MVNNNQQLLNKSLNTGIEQYGKTGRVFSKTTDQKKKTQHTIDQWHVLSAHTTLFRKSTLSTIIALGRQYTTKFHVRDLARTLHYDASIISKNLKYLEHNYLVTRENVGNMVLYQANMNNVLIKQIKIFYTLLELNELVQNIEPVASNIILYGSCATGEDTDDSDIDIFIETMDKKTTKNIMHTGQKTITRTISPIITTPDETYAMKLKDSNLYSSIHQGIRLKGDHHVS